MIPGWIVNFDPRDRAELLAVDAWACSTGEEVFPIALPPACSWKFQTLGPETAIDWPDWLLADWLQATRECPRWGISYDMIQIAEETLPWLEYEARRRVQMAEKRQKALRENRYASWQDYDLLTAVEAVCGEGRKTGQAYWFRCPFHEDRNPSFELDPVKKVWKCWAGCGGGGVVEWRKRMETR